MPSQDILKDYQTLLNSNMHLTPPPNSVYSNYVHSTVHTMSLIYQLILELATTDDDDASSSSSDPEQAARDEALGIGGAKLKAVLSDMKKNTSNAPFREDVRVTIASSGLYEWLLKVISVNEKPMLAIDALTLDYNVKFPLSLVIFRKIILRYQPLFRFLLHLKHVAQSLASMRIEQKMTPWWRPVHNHPEFEQWRMRVALLRARMLAFV